MNTNLAIGYEKIVLLCLCARSTALSASALHRNTVLNTWLQTSRHGCAQCIRGEYCASAQKIEHAVRRE